MSLEKGGRADKYGNNYENRYLAVLLLRLVRETLKYVIVEPLGDNSDSVEFITETKEGRILHYQCKASNADHSEWSVADLNRYDVFDRAKKILQDNTANNYYFISPLAYRELDELCKRARTSTSAEDWKKYQLSNQKIKDTFQKAASALNFNPDIPEELEELYLILSRCYFENVPYGTETDRDIDEKISLIFSGKASAVRVLLEQYANTNRCFGKKILATHIVDYLNENDFHLRILGADSTVVQRISVINDTYWGIYPAINDSLFHRAASDQIISELSCGRSVILHGKAGMGKSGCLQEVIDYLKEQSIPYLAVKLDKQKMEQSADHFGKTLELPESPVHCLAQLSAGQKCVLIIDQLDALRWSSIHSADAITICKELIQQADVLNRQENADISIIFATRTFDLENDSGIKTLFEFSDDEKSKTWTRIAVNEFTQDEIKTIIGDEYNNLSQRLKVILRTPSSLYVWSQLDKGARDDAISTAYELISQWWGQIIKGMQKIGIAEKDLVACKDRIVDKMSATASFSLPKALFSGQITELEALISSGILSSDASKRNVSFTHQSILDYFLSCNMIDAIYSGKEIVELLGERDDQIPVVRYRLIGVLQQLISNDSAFFVSQAQKLLQSPNVRFYMQCAVFEVIGQCVDPDETILTFVEKYLHDFDWREYVYNTVYSGHPAFIMKYRTENWMSDSARMLLRSVNYMIPDFVVEKLKPFAFQNAEQDKLIYQTLYFDESYDTDEAFQFRMDLLNHNPGVYGNFISLSHVIERNSPHGIQMMAFVLSNYACFHGAHVHLGNEKLISLYARTYCKEIVQSLFPIINKMSSAIRQSIMERYSWYDERDWASHQYNESAARAIVELTKEAFIAFSKTDPKSYVKFLSQINYEVSGVGHEILMDAILALPIEFADAALSWILEDFDNRILVLTKTDDDYLLTAKEVLTKFTVCCSQSVFTKTERTILMWHEPRERMVSRYKHRLETNKERCYQPVYYAFWGHLQKELLPCLCNERISSESNNLIQVLNRNEWVAIPHFHYVILSGESGIISSPVDKKRSSLSDKTWLRIIATLEEKLQNRWNRNFEEASHWAFASSLGRQAEQEPKRFAELSLHFPDACDSHYIGSVINALAKEKAVQYVPLELMEKVILRFHSNADFNVAMAICRLVESLPEEKWSLKTLEVIKEIAINHPHPGEGDFIAKSDDPEHRSVHTIHTYSYNCARGYAFHAISALLWANPELSNYFVTAIRSAISDNHDAVRFAAIMCILPLYNSLPDDAIEIAKGLIEADIRCIAVPGFWQIISRKYRTDGKFYFEKLDQGLKSPIEDLANTSAGYLCAIAIYYNDRVALERILCKNLSKKQIHSVCRQAASCFSQEEYNAISKSILEFFFDEGEATSIAHLLHEKKVLIERDSEFLKNAISSSLNEHFIHTFLEYFSEAEPGDCLKLAPILAVIGNQCAKGHPERRVLFPEEFSRCVNKLFDIGSQDRNIKKICLDIWDDFFRGSLYNTKTMKDLFESYGELT